MSSRNKYKLDLMRFDKVKERTVYLIGDIACLVGHILYFTMFCILAVKPMMILNIFSVAFYSLMIWLIFKVEERKVLVLAALVEFMVHACLGVYSLGWGMGFGMILLFIMPIPFYLPLNKFVTPYLFSLVPLSLYIVMMAIFGRPGVGGLYTFNDPVLKNIIYSFNIAVGALIMLYISSIYMINRELMQYKLVVKNESLKKLAAIDPLTQLFNRRAMGEHIRIMQRNCEQTGKGYVVCLGDIDDFKMINDNYGHESGDDALKIAAGIIGRNIPAEGYAGRWGGEEFLFVIPNAGVKEGAECAERIRSAIAAKKFSAAKGDFSITITIGVSTGKADEDIEKVISRADTQLYRGKEQGKNRVTFEE